MALTPRLDLRQTQSLVMTPQLQQAIKLLQLSSLDLCAYVEAQLEENPLLERDEGTPERGDDTITPDASAGLSADGDPPSLDAAVAEPAAMTDGVFDTGYFDNVFDRDTGDDGGAFGATVESWRGRGGSFDEQGANIEEMLSGKPTLHQHLMAQVSLDIDDPVDRIIAVHLIDHLDGAGYFQGSLATIAEQLACPVERVEATLYTLQRFDPTGVFARSLKECLALQLEDRGRLDAPMRRLLDNLGLVANQDRGALIRTCGVDAHRLRQMVAEIRSLNPKPALGFDDTVAQIVTPDVVMRPQPAGGWLIELNSETLPRVLVNNHYYAQVSASARKREDRQYINECLQSANWLVKSLHQRATTILKVSTEIVRHQEGFFINGVQSLRPLVLRDIAETIGMHESTVSRVTSNKYMSTPRGIYELKYFFTHAVGGGEGDDARSAEAVRHRLKLLIDGETAATILSDDTLAERLQQEGIDIARRTVAKYREAMGIPSSVRRRRLKNETL
jgi:RNA polymerase sigma-54 factor